MDNISTQKVRRYVTQIVFVILEYPPVTKFSKYREQNIKKTFNRKIQTLSMTDKSKKRYICMNKHYTKG